MKEEKPMRLSRTLALGASVLVLFGACSTGGGGTPSPSTAAPSSDGGASPSAAGGESPGLWQGVDHAVEEIRAEIEGTRQELGGTLNELGDRLEPGHVVQQVKENVREATIGRVEETAKGVSEMVMDTIRRNPIPAALAGAGLAMLWVNRSQGPQGGRASYGTGYGYQGRPASTYEADGGQGIASKARDAASSVGAHPSPST